MGYKQPNNPMKMMKSALKMHKAEKKAGMHRDSAMYMNSPMYKGHSPMEMGHSPMEMGHSPMEMGHSPMEMGHESPAKKYDSPMNKKESRELKDMPIVDIEKGDAKGSPAKAAKPDFPDIDGDGNTSESMKQAAADKKKGSPAKKYDRVVLGGNKGDKSKTKPGKKDYEGKGSPAKISEKAAERKAKKGKGFISQKPGGKDTEKSFTKLTRKGRKEMKETGMVSSKEMKKTKKIK